VTRNQDVLVSCTIGGTNEAKNILSNGSLERDEEGVESPRGQEKSTQIKKKAKEKGIRINRPQGSLPRWMKRPLQTNCLWWMNPPSIHKILPGITIFFR
jgi:hypothetical protein